MVELELWLTLGMTELSSAVILYLEVVFSALALRVRHLIYTILSVSQSSLVLVAKHSA